VNRSLNFTPFTFHSDSLLELVVELEDEDEGDQDVEQDEDL
jgi:hypothetical protein